jgi:hypothetical protein
MSGLLRCILAVEGLSSPVLAPAVCSLLWAAGRGLPGGNSLFFWVAKRKVSKRKGDPAVCVPALRYGQPAVLGPDGVKNNSPAAQTSFCPDPSGPALLGAYRRGWGRNTNSPIPNTKQPKTGLRIPEETRTRHGESLLVLVPAPDSDCPLWMRRGAQVQADQGSRLSEPKASSSETPPEPSTAGCPVAQRRGRRNQGRLFFGDFLLAKQKKVTCMPGNPRPATLSRTRSFDKTQPSAE